MLLHVAQVCFRITISRGEVVLLHGHLVFGLVFEAHHLVCCVGAFNNMGHLSTPAGVDSLLVTMGPWL